MESTSTVPPELETLLLQYTITVLMEQPDDVIEHAANYFNDQLDRRNRQSANLDADGKERRRISSNLGSRSGRRKSVSGEKFDPESEGPSAEELETYPKSEEDRQKILERVRKIFLFQTMDDADMNKVIDAMKPRDVEAEQVIIREGDDGDFFYVVDSGTFHAFVKSKPDRPVCRYEGDGYFGELALLYNQPRAATVVAKTDGRLWAMSRRVFRRLVVRGDYEKTKRYVTLLTAVPALEPLSEYEKMQVSDALVPVVLKEGDLLFEEGDEGDGMYFLEEGSISINQETKNKGNVQVAKLEKGDYFGELALVKKQPRAGSAVALEDSRLAFLEVEAFERLMGPCQDMLNERIQSYPAHE